MKKLTSLLILSTVLFCMFSVHASALGEKELLAAYIEGEAEKEGLSVMCAVGSVIKNRCIHGGSVVSEGAALGIIPSPSPSPMAYYAASLVLGGFDLTDGATVFYKDTSLSPDMQRLVTYSVDGYFFVRQ